MHNSLFSNFYPFFLVRNIFICHKTIETIKSHKIFFILNLTAEFSSVTYCGHYFWRFIILCTLILYISITKYKSENICVYKLCLQKNIKLPLLCLSRAKKQGKYFIL